MGLLRCAVMKDQCVCRCLMRTCVPLKTHLDPVLLRAALSASLVIACYSIYALSRPALQVISHNCWRMNAPF